MSKSLLNIVSIIWGFGPATEEVSVERLEVMSQKSSYKVAIEKEYRKTKKNDENCDKFA